MLAGKGITIVRLDGLRPSFAMLCACRYTAYNKAVIEDMSKSMIDAYAQLGWPTRHEGLPLNVDHL
jgi:hypothetical protein